MGLYTAIFGENLKILPQPEPLELANVKKQFRGVLKSYTCYLFTISHSVNMKYQREVDDLRDEYENVQKEMAEFIMEHEKYLKVQSVKVKVLF